MAANVMEIYGSKVFNEHVMKERLPLGRTRDQLLKILPVPGHLSNTY